MTFANRWGPDEAQQNVGHHLVSKLFDTQIIYLQNNCQLLFAIFERIERCKRLLSKLTLSPLAVNFEDR